jgi:adenylate cyclase
VMGYKGSTKKVKEIGGELEVGSVLEGSIRKAGNRVRITAQLIDAATEGHLWAQNYDRNLEDIFAVQSEIAEKVAGELKVRLVDEERRVIEKKPTENTEAYALYLRGRQLLGERTKLSLNQALGVFEKAIDLDPSFAKAYAGLAECHGWLVNDNFEPYEQAAPKAELAAKRALQLDPELAEAHAALSSVYFLEDHVKDGIMEAKRAIELNPSLPHGYDALCDFALLNQDKEEAIRAAETAYRLDPVMPRYVERLGKFYFYTGREADALRHWEKTAQLAPAGTYRNMAEYYLSKGDLEKAKEFHSMAEQLEPTNRWGTWMRGFIAALAGDKETAREVIKEIEGKWVGATNLNDLAFIHYAMGDLDTFFMYIDKATDQHTVRYAYVMYSPLFAKAREDPRYQEFLKKMAAIAEA